MKDALQFQGSQESYDLLVLSRKEAIRPSSIIAVGYCRHALAQRRRGAASSPECLPAYELAKESIPCNCDSGFVCCTPWNAYACRWSVRGAIEWLGAKTTLEMKILEESVSRILRIDYTAMFMAQSPEQRLYFMSPETDRQTFLECIDSYYNQATMLKVLRDAGL